MEKLRGPGKPYQTQTQRGSRGNTHPSQLHLIFASESLPGSPHLAVQKLPHMVTSTGKAGIWAHKPTLSSLAPPRAVLPCTLGARKAMQSGDPRPPQSGHNTREWSQPRAHTAVTRGAVNAWCPGCPPAANLQGGQDPWAPLLSVHPLLAP